MPSKNDCWGIEVGANAIKAIRLGRSGARVDVLDYDILPFKTILTTPDLNVDEAIQVNLDAFMAKHDVSKSSVIVSVPGHTAFARFAKLPPVEPKKIPDIVRFEAVQQIPFPIEQVEWDYQVFQQEDSPDVEVGIFAITKERVVSFLNNYRRVGLQVDALTLSPIAVYNAYAYEQAEDGGGADGTILMDIGTQSTDVIIVDNGGIWLRTLPIGGNNFTEALVKAFKLSFPKAEKLKREARTSKYARQIFQAMRPVFADLVQEIQRSLGYYQSLNRDAELKKLVGFGSTFRLPGLQKFLKQQLQMDVVRPDSFKRVHVEGKQESDFVEHTINFATAYGLALQGLGQETVSANILPNAILKARMWKSKQPWIGAAAAAVVLAAGLAGGRYFMDSMAYDSAVGQHSAQIDRVIRDARGLQSEMNELNTNSDPRIKIENLRRVLDYRDLWPKILEDVSMAASAVRPQPVLLETSYDEIGKIPRSQRRRVYIESIEADYLPRPETSAPDEDPLTGNHRIETFWTGSDAPQIEVRVTGTTPYSQASTMLSREFIGWLQRNANRPDRPYTIIVPEQPLTNVMKVGVTEVGRSGAAARGTRGNRAGYNPRGNTGYTPRGGRGSAPVPAGVYDGYANFGNFGAGRGGPVSREGLLPQRPLLDESRADDWSFTVTWIVELRKPEDARKAEINQAGLTAPEGVTPESGDEPAAPETPQPPVEARAPLTAPEEARS